MDSLYRHRGNRALHDLRNAASLGALTPIEPCWICSAPAGSREHRVKRSDLAGVFSGDISQKNPLHFRSGVKKALIGSVKTDKMKFPPYI